MADSVISLEKLKSIWHSQVHDEEKWALNVVSKGIESRKIFAAHSSRCEEEPNTKKLLRAAGLFAGSILLMRNYGDLMAI